MAGSKQAGWKKQAPPHYCALEPRCLWVSRRPYPERTRCLWVVGCPYPERTWHQCTTAPHSQEQLCRHGLCGSLGRPESKNTTTDSCHSSTEGQWNRQPGDKQLCLRHT